MLFSIIVPIYNVEPFIERCIDSLIGQTYGNIEIILVDDESPDSCPRICDEYAARDGRIKVIHKKNGGLSDARNAGLETASGDYVIFVDSDDYVSKDMCENLAAFASAGADVLIGEATVEGGVCDLSHVNAAEHSESGAEYLKRAMLASKAPMAAWLNVYRREFLCSNGLRFKYGILHEDEQFTPRALLKADSVVLTGVDFYRYIIRDGSITTKKDKRKNAKDFYETCCELETVYNGLKDAELRAMLLDSLASKYLSLFESGDLSRYGREYLPAKFLKRVAQSGKTKSKVKLICISPRLYHLVRGLVKR